MKRGLWLGQNETPGKNTGSAAAGVPAEVKSQVRLFVRGTANALLVYPRQVGDLSNPAFLPSLQYALARGIQELFEVEESELASELIGEGDHLGILFWEGAEGGLGVLRRLVQEPSARQPSPARRWRSCTSTLLPAPTCDRPTIRPTTILALGPAMSA